MTKGEWPAENQDSEVDLTSSDMIWVILAKSSDAEEDDDENDGDDDIDGWVNASISQSQGSDKNTASTFEDTFEDDDGDDDDKEEVDDEDDDEDNDDEDGWWMWWLAQQANASHVNAGRMADQTSQTWCWQNTGKSTKSKTKYSWMKQYFCFSL